MKDKFIWFFLIVSITFNLIVIIVDVIPYLWPILKRKLNRNVLISENVSNEIILNQAIEMLNTKNSNVWEDDYPGFTRTLHSFLLGKKKNKEFRIYNYPNAYLYYGLSTHLIKVNDLGNLEKVRSSFDNIIESDGRPVFVLDKVDQVPYGLTALNLYKVYGDEKYLKFCATLYEMLVLATDDDGIILYRKKSDKQYNDVIGMTIPFLVEYSDVNKNPNILDYAKQQLEFYIKYGVDKETYLPTHGIDLITKIKIGPTNWGRGIGWYFLGISWFYKQTGEFKEEYEGLKNTLNKLRTEEGLWTQFPGSSSAFDASSSTMFLYCMKDDLSSLHVGGLNNLYKYISKEGCIMGTSGDTYGINNYSKTFGKSELSQGFLLLLI